MNKIILFFFCLTLSIIANSQFIDNTEIGVDGSFSASTLGGSYAFSLKYGIKSPNSPDFIFGPSFRMMRFWSNAYYTNYSSHANIIGGGLFAHYRIQNVLFLGAESEILKNPYAIINNTTIKTAWVPTLFVGGGFSKEYKERFRLNVGVFYDVINSKNSPFRSSYVMKKTDPITKAVIGYIPVIYRIALFIRL